MNASWNLGRLILGRLGVAERRSFALAIALAAVTLAAGIGLLGVSGWFLTAASLTTAAAVFNLFGPSSLVRGLSMVRILSRYGEKLVGHDATLRWLADLRVWLFRGMLPLMPLDPALWRHGDLVSRLTADVEALDTVVLTAIGPLVTALLGGAAMVALLSATLPAAIPIFLLGYAVAVLAAPVWLLWRGAQPGRLAVEQQAALRSAVLDGIDGHADFVLFGQTERISAQVEDASKAMAKVSIRRAGQAADAGMVSQFAGGATMLAVLWVGLHALQTGAIDGPWLVGILLASLASFEVAAGLVRGAGKFGAASAAADRLRALAETSPGIAEPQHPVALSHGSDIRLDHVTVQRRPERVLLRDVSMQVRPGDRIALIGESGVGKSTLLDLLLRLVEPNCGRVFIGGTDIAGVAAADLYRNVALMSQTTPIFLGTVRDNLHIGRADADDEALWGALRRARLAETIAALPDGLSTWLGEGGKTLSGGEARRLCLARTLLSPASILLLDEPTSGLDRESELAFLADLGSATAGRTVILATHAALPEGTVDRVFRLRDGRLSELR